MNSKDIMIFGDSIVFGNNDYEKGGWVNRLRLKMEECDPNKNSYIYNLGIPGNNSNDLLKRFDIECSIRAEEAENLVIIFGIGTNDAKKMNTEKTRKQVFENNMVTMIKQAKKYTNKIVCIGLISVDEEIVPDYKNKNINQIDEVLKKVCTEEKVKYIYMNYQLSKEDLSDGIHPNSEGHQKIFEKVFREIKGL